MNLPVHTPQLSISRPGVSQPGQESELGEVIKVVYRLRERWLLIALIAALGLAGAAFFCMKAPPLYRASALLEVARQEQNIVHMDDVTKQDLAQVDALNTLVQKCTRGAVLQRVVAASDLARHPAFAAAGGTKASDGLIVSQLFTLVHAQLRRNTRLLEISAEHWDPAVSQMLANQVAEQFIRQEIE